MEDTEEISQNTEDGAVPAPAAEEGGEEKRPAGKLKKFFTYEKVSVIVYAFFALVFLSTVISGLTDSYHHFYSNAQAGLTVTQSLRCFLVILAPIVLEKCFGIRLDLKLVAFLCVFCVFSVTLGEGLKVYYSISWWDKALHFISGAMQVYIFFGFAQLMLKDSPSKNKFWYALFLAFFGSMAIAALWELLEFATDCFTGSNMQKVIPPGMGGGDNGYNCWLPLDSSVSDEAIGEYYRTPDHYRYGIMDSMMDMVMCLFGSLAFIAIMAVVRLIKKDAFENSVKFDKGYRFGFIKNFAAKRRAKGATDKTE